MPRRIENQLRVRAVGSNCGSFSLTESETDGGLFPSSDAIVMVRIEVLTPRDVPIKQVAVC